jgi:hypothetical protein
VIAAERVGGTPYNCLGVANQAVNKKIKHTIAFGQPMIDNGSHNNQPKTGICNGGEYGEDVRWSGGAGGSAIPLFWGH